MVPLGRAPWGQHRFMKPGDMAAGTYKKSERAARAACNSSRSRKRVTLSLVPNYPSVTQDLFMTSGG